VKRWVKPLLFVLCLAPLAWMTYELFAGRIRGEWVKDITQRTGWWGLFLITTTLAITPLRRVSGWNAVAGYRRMLGLFAFSYILVHLLIYVVLDRQIFVPGDSFIMVDKFAVKEIADDIAKRPYITVGMAGFLMMVPLALTSTRGWIRRLGKRWTQLHSLVYVVALAGVVHFMWLVKADTAVPVRFALVIVALLALRLVPRHVWTRRVAASPRAAPPLEADGVRATQ
jgi:methionine sulfoxide reductase heme-binding subunit